MPDDKSISELTSAPDFDDSTLVEVATVDQSSETGYSSYNGGLGDIFDKILRATRFTQRLNTTDKTVFGAINELQAGGGGGGSSTLSGLTDVDITTPSNGQVLKYDSTSQKWENAAESGGGDSVSWTQITQSGTKIAEIDINGTSTDVYAPSGGGSANIVECTQAEYDAWEQAGTLDPDTAYFINDGNIGDDIIDDSSTAQDKVWSAYKTDSVSNMAIQNDENIGYLSDDLAPRFDISANYAVGDYCLYNKLLYRFTSAKSAGAWDSTKVTSVKVGTELKAKQDSDVLNITTSFAANTSIVNAVGSLITQYGTRTMIFGFVITGYGWVSGMMTFYDSTQGGGYAVANNKGKNGNTPALYSLQYVNGTVTMGYPWVDPNS